MQVSTPAHVPGEQEFIQSKSGQTKSLKHDKLGVFAKILEGLTQNPKGEAPGSGLLAKSSAKGAIPDEKGTVHNQEVKGKKKASGLSGEKKSKETALVTARSSRRNTKVSEEGVVSLVSQNNEKKSPAQEGNHIHQKAKKDEASLKNLSSHSPVHTSQPETPAEVSEIPSAEVLAKLLSKEESEPKTRKAPEKGETLKAESGSRTVRSEGAAESAPFNTQRVSRNIEKDLGTDKAVESKGKDKRRERLNVEVRDLRSSEEVQYAQTQGSQPIAEAQSGIEAETPDLSVDLSSGSKTREEAFREIDYRPVQAFEDILARELHQNLNNDIVRQAQIILREHGEGTIRLALKPETLGNVKIQLEMTENKITGHIIVESNEALRAFEREIHSLEQAFKDSGFAGAHLDMSLASGNGGNGAEQRRRDLEAQPFLSERFAASIYDAASDNAEATSSLIFANRSDSGLSQVNMLV